MQKSISKDEELKAVEVKDEFAAQNARASAERRIVADLQNGSTVINLAGLNLLVLSFLGSSGQDSSSQISESMSIWENVMEVDVSQNMLTSIDDLNKLRNMRKLNASYNFISACNLNLPKLEELDLRNNNVIRFPLLHLLPKLRILNLNSNQISDFRVELKPPSCLSVVQLDIGSNLINFASNQDFYENFLEKVKKLKNMKALVIAGNAFVSGPGNEQRLDQIVAQLPLLEMLNDEKASVFRRMQVMTEASQEEKKAEPGKTRGGYHQKSIKEAKNQLYIPTLDMLRYNLEAANSHPTFALEHLRDLMFDVDKLSEHLDMIDEHFAKGKNEVEINDTIEEFMQNSQMLINTHADLQNIMLTILSKLSIIKFYDFGVRCFNTLKDLMVAGRDMEEKVTEIIKREVILKLHQQQNPETVPASLLRGLHELVKQTEKSDMLTGLYENCFPQWIRLLLVRINNSKKVGGIYENNPHFDAALALMSVSLHRDHEGGGGSRKNAEKALEKDLAAQVADVLNESTWEQTRYLHCLKVVELLCMHETKAADQFVDKFVHNNIMKNVKYAVQVYKKFSDLRSEELKETEERVRLRYVTLAAEICCLGGLLEAERGRRKQIIEDPLIDDLCQIASHYKTDPILLTAICRFAKQLFTRDELRLNPLLIEPKVKRMQNLVQLVPYLGLKKYEELLRMSRKYYDSEAFAEREKATQLQHLDDVIVHELFIAIVKLINFFCVEAEKKDAAPVFQEVSQALNDCSREAGLFNCLEVPNDEVKLAVVECLNNVPLSEFDSEEIATIIRLLGNCKNIGAGKTELVLAKIFWILTKLNNDMDEDSGKNFRIKFGERAINEAMEILIRNQSRQLEDPAEEQEKLALSLSCLHFLKFISVNPETRQYLLNRHDQFKHALYLDENCTSYEMSKCPVEVEETWLGRNMDVLLHAVTGGGGSDSVTPYNFVSFRLLQRMADVLMNHNVEELNDVIDPFHAGIDVIEHLKMNYSKKFKERKFRERSHWMDPDEVFLSRVKQSQARGDDTQFNNFYKQQHHWFTSNNGIPLLRMFLMKKLPACEQWLNREFDSAYDTKHSLSLEKQLLKAKKKAEEKEAEHQRKEDEKKSKTLVMGSGHAKDEQSELTGIQILKRELQKTEIGQYYDSERASDHFISNSKAKSQNVENIKKRDYKKGGVQNLKMRSLCVAAYLRCLYAAIEYAPSESLKQEAITQLKDVFIFRMITQLCDTTGWLEANIGAKYLRVMKHVIKVPFVETTEGMDRLAHYEIVSIVIRKLINLVLVKIKNEQQKQLSNEDKVLIYELTSMCQLICSQSASLFRWSSVEVKQQGQHARTRRTPQEKIIDKQISLLFPSSSIFTLIAIVFRDMEMAYKLFNESSEKQKESPFISHKNQMARECIRQFMGDYLSKCKDYKYDILEAFMKGVVFEKKKLRESFLQEILKAHVDSGCRSSIEDFILVQKFVIEPERRERIALMLWVEVTFNGLPNHCPRLLLFTNKGIHIMKPPAGKPCTVCPPENLCPNGPRQEFKFKYERLVEIITFPHIPQKFVIVFTQANPQSGDTKVIRKDLVISVSIIVPTYYGALQMQSLLNEIVVLFGPQTKLQIQNDYMLRWSLERHITNEDQNGELYFAEYVSFNPSKGFMGFGGGDSIIPNCMLLALTSTYIIILKENWAKWQHESESSSVKKILAQYRHAEDMIVDAATKLKEDKLKAQMEGVLTQVAKYRLDGIENLHVHKGKDPIVDIEVSRGKVEKIIFQCDYSRQQFIQALVSAKNGDASAYANNIL